MNDDCDRSTHGDQVGARGERRAAAAERVLRRAGRDAVQRRATARIPNLMKIYAAGELWPLTLTQAAARDGDGAVRPDHSCG